PERGAGHRQRDQAGGARRRRRTRPASSGPSARGSRRRRLTESSSGHGPSPTVGDGLFSAHTVQPVRASGARPLPPIHSRDRRAALGAGTSASGHPADFAGRLTHIRRRTVLGLCLRYRGAEPSRSRPARAPPGHGRGSGAPVPPPAPPPGPPPWSSTRAAAAAPGGAETPPRQPSAAPPSRRSTCPPTSPPGFVLTNDSESRRA